ncbi:MAG: DUF4317 domain-containing protein [Lachnospiraceae bacterium]
MIKTEINEVRKLFSDAHCAISRICGCYVGGEKNKITTFREAFLSLSDEDATRYFQILRKGLSGTICKQLHTLEFPLEAEFSDGAQASLLALRDSHLEDDELLENFYDKVIETYPYTQHYLILLVDCSYDVPGKTTDGLTMDDASDEVYHFIYCVMCPVKQSKPSLTYVPEDNLFQNRICDWIVDAPMNAVLFPAFEDRCCDIHHTLYYTKDTEKPFADFAYELLGCTLPISAGVQKDSFQAIVLETLGEQNQMHVVKQIHDTLYDMIEEHEDEEAPLTLHKYEVKEVLEKSGLSNEQLATFDKHFDEVVGSEAVFDAVNIAETRKLEVKTPDITIKVNPECSDLIEKKTIDGKTYLMIEVNASIEVNGIPCK